MNPFRKALSLHTMVKYFEHMSPAARKKAVAKMQKPQSVWWAAAKWTKMKPKEVKAAVEAVFKFGAWQMSKAGSFKLAGMLKMTLNEKPATQERKGVNPLTKEPCVFKAKAARKTVRISPLTKLKKLANRDYSEQRL